MERWLSAPVVVAVWGALNTLLAGLLAGFTAAGIDGSPGPGGALGFAIYAAASALVFVIALLVSVIDSLAREHTTTIVFVRAHVCHTRVRR